MKPAIEWLVVDPGDGFARLLHPRLTDRRTLYIAPKLIGEHRLTAWNKLRGCDVDLRSNLQAKHIIEDDLLNYDQMLVTEIGVATKQYKDYPLRQSRAYKTIVNLINKFPGPVLWRPKFGQETSFRIVHIDTRRAIAMNRMGHLMLPPEYNLNRFEDLDKYGRVDLKQTARARSDTKGKRI